MKKIILSFILAMVTIASFGQSNETKLIERINYNKVMMDSCYKMSMDQTIKKSHRNKYKREYTAYKINYERFNKKYDKLYGVKNPINEAGKYLKRSAKYEAFSLGFITVGAVATIAITSSEGSDSNTAAIATGAALGTAGLSCYIASIINKHKAGKFLNNVKFTGTGVQITF